MLRYLLKKNSVFFFSCYFQSFNYQAMEKIQKIFAWLVTLPVWSRLLLIAAAAAAVVAVSLSSCAASAHVRRDGVHIDTVRVDYIIKSKNSYQL